MTFFNTLLARLGKTPKTEAAPAKASEAPVSTSPSNGFQVTPEQPLGIDAAAAEAPAAVAGE